MGRFERIYRLHGVLATARLPVPMGRLEEELECSRSTVKRVIQEMRLYLGAPIEYHRERNGYFYDQGAGTYELPGLWFNASELHALLLIQQLLKQVQPGLLGTRLAPLGRRIERILQAEHLSPGRLTEKIRILAMASRPAGRHFQVLADALLQGRRLRLEYHGRARDAVSRRTVSPQRMVHYRDNWYLDAWCHEREALRVFAVDRVLDARVLDEPARELDARWLQEQLASAYGIFSGPARNLAVLRFTPQRARWVAEERWHSGQQGRFLDDGRYELRLPYNDPRELILDVLRYGPEVEVVSPAELRRAVAEKLRAAAAIYGGGAGSEPPPVLERDGSFTEDST